MTPEKKINRQLWDAWASLHFDSEFYDVDTFRCGGITLPACDIAGVGDVKGKSLLHLQCHFGMDTLSWARLGAKATGLDFSGKSIDLARQLAGECGLDVEFVEADVYAAPEVLDQQFDLVVTTAGVLPWLPDVRRWAEVVARMLRPGGTFYLREFHPVAQVFDETSPEPNSPHLRYPYFPTGDHICSATSGSYAVPQSAVETTSYEWPHTLGGVVQALIDAGLRITAMHEYPFTTYRSFPWLIRGEGNTWHWPGDYAPVPLMYSIGAVSEGGALRKKRL